MSTELEVSQYQWLTAMQAAEMADIEIARMAYWCKSPRREAKPDLITMIALWAEADEKSRLLENDALETRGSALLSINEIKQLVAKQEGFMMASEDHQPKRYQQLLNQQAQQRIANFLLSISVPAESLSEEDLEALLDERDTLEYARMGINVIRMQGRLPEVDYDSFAAGLRQIDQALHGFLPEHIDIEKPPYVPSTFWWRR